MIKHGGGFGASLLLLAACSSSTADVASSEEEQNGGCGTERWTVKIGTDPGASGVNLTNVKTTTISQMRSLTPPASLPQSSRVAPTELTVFEIKNVEITLVKSEADQDYHVVITDSSKQTMIAEIPSSSCVDSTTTPWKAQIDLARKNADAKFAGKTGTVTITGVSLKGVGFFDKIHGQSGVAPNGIELHPVLGICFNAGCTP